MPKPLYTSTAEGNSAGDYSAQINAPVHGSVSVKRVTGRPAQSFGGAFYAYIHDVAKDHTWRMVIVFASRLVADEWWRAISTSTVDFLKNNLQRVTPQFYTHNTQRWNFYHFFSDYRVRHISNQFRGKMFLVLENDVYGRGISIIPTQTIVDHANGDWFTIRSKANAAHYWHYDEGMGCITVSDTQRTSFKISSTSTHEGAIMIGADDMILMVQDDAFIEIQAWDGPPGSSLVGITSLRSKAFPFKFGDLDKGCFLFNTKKLPSPLNYTPAGGGGAAWELSL